MIFQDRSFNGLSFVSVSDIGANHRALLMPNQDAVSFTCNEENFVVAVSDGVGSCKKAEKGSNAAVKACVHVFSEIQKQVIPFEKDAIISAILYEWRSKIMPDFEDDCCATLKAAFKINNVIKTVSVGDGFICITSDESSLLSPEEKNDFTNETKCLGSHIQKSDFWFSDFYVDLYKSFVVFCCTDGVSNGLISGTERELVNDIEKSIKSDALKATLQDLLNDISNYCNDDKTVGVVKYERTN